MVSGFEHTALVSPDPEKLAQWYVERFGFSINYHSPSSKTTFVKAPNGSMLEIITSNVAPRQPQTLRDEGIRHLAIAVTDFDAVYQSLKAAGVNFISEPENNKGNRVVFFTDPDGNYLHLLQREKPLP
jgi:glyoxylase I family protein